VLRLAQPFLRAKLQRRGVAEPGYLVAMDERFGRYASQPQPDSAFVWIHAVSLGETMAAAVLIAGLRQRLPAMRLLLTHGTATGRAEGVKLLRNGDVQAWAPWDTPEAVLRFLAHFKPRIGILMETEVWPNQAAICQQQQVPLVLANARLSDKSLRQALKLAWLSRPAYQSLAAVWAQTRADADRLAQLGAPVQGIFGNLKFDASPAPELLTRGRAWRAALPRPVIMFASSREGEEALLLAILDEKRPENHDRQAYTATKKIAKNVQFLIVPRHPQRFDEVANLITQHGFKVSRRSDWGDAPASEIEEDGHADNGAATLWLGDSLGEMALYYAMSDVALLGGSFAALGGQNLIEAAACGCPVVMGPHTFNFAQAAELAQSAGAAIRVASMEQAVEEVVELTANPLKLAVASQSAKSFAQNHQGATGKLVDAVVQVLASPKTAQAQSKML
jgi:3-deoxy-D-manno-octulosonic-acid transferase